MELDMYRLPLFNGKPIKLLENIKLYSPTIDEITDIGENDYNLNIIFATFNIKTILLYFYSDNVTEEMLDSDELKEIDSFEFFTSEQNETLFDTFCKAISFFIKEEVVLSNGIFYVNDKPFLTKDNYKQFIELVKKVTCTSENEEEKMQFKNDRVKQKYKKMQELKRKYNMDKGIDLKDICSILCNADGNGINIFNVGKMTIYQVYEHWERLGIKEGYNRTLMLWANTFSMSENGKVQEWMIKSKL